MGEMLRLNLVIAITAIMSHRLRSGLTLMGVTIGVASVILVVALGKAGQHELTKSIDALGRNLIIVFPIADAARTSQGGAVRGRLAEGDAEMLRRTLQGVESVAPQLKASTESVTAEGRVATQAVGVDAGYVETSRPQLAAGRFLLAEELRSDARVVVIGKTLAEKLFAGQNPVGGRIRMAGTYLTVVGVLKRNAGEQDKSAILPINVVRHRLLGDDAGGPERIDALSVKFSPAVAPKLARQRVVEKLRTRYRVRDGAVDPFTAMSTEEFAAASKGLIDAFRAVLAAIASISLVVGGIGITNIMIVSVTERTREIGIRLAIGAGPAVIRQQFLVEAIILCVLGGVIGTGLSLLVTLAIQAAAGWEATADLQTVLLAIGFSGVLGLVAGVYPASRAAGLKPIEALRAE